MLETLNYSIFLLREKSRKAHLKIFFFFFFSALYIRSKSEKREEINFNSINNKPLIISAPVEICVSISRDLIWYVRKDLKACYIKLIKKLEVTFS